MTFVDSNILIDIFSRDALWFDWSSEQLRNAGTGSLTIDAIVVGELASGFADMAELQVELDRMGIDILPLEDEVAFLAGKRFAAYRRSERERTSLIADFIIGAHAVSIGSPLLTRDRKLYARYFPELILITPEVPNV